MLIYGKTLRLMGLLCTVISKADHLGFIRGTIIIWNFVVLKMKNSIKGLAFMLQSGANDDGDHSA